MLLQLYFTLLFPLVAAMESTQNLLSNYLTSLFRKSPESAFQMIKDYADIDLDWARKSIMTHLPYLIRYPSEMELLKMIPEHLWRQIMVDDDFKTQRQTLRNVLQQFYPSIFMDNLLGRNFQRAPSTFALNIVS